MGPKQRKGRGGRYTPPQRAVRPPAVNAQVAARYLQEYVTCYRHEYERFTTPSPNGPGYPRLDVSPYLAGTIDCLLATDGAVICLFGPDTDIDWLQTDNLYRVQTSSPPANMGAMTLGPRDLAADIASGIIPPPLESARLRSENDMDFRVARFDVPVNYLIKRLTVSAWEHATSPQNSYFWMPFIARRLLFQSVSGKQRYFDYLEILDHVDPAAWDFRSAALRAYTDVRRDFIAAAANPAETGTLTAASWPAVRASFGDVLVRLNIAIESFQALLEEHPNAEEERFHRYLLENPILLDAYATATSKPRFTYPEPQVHTDKTYVEPDIVLAFPGQRYRLIELERPDHAVLRKEGEARASVTHASFQTAEWMHFVANYPHVLQDRFPGLVADRCTYTIVIGRRTEGDDFIGRQDVMARTFAGAEIMTYDDVLDRATSDAHEAARPCLQHACP